MEEGFENSSKKRLDKVKRRKTRLERLPIDPLTTRFMGDDSNLPCGTKELAEKTEEMMNDKILLTVRDVAAMTSLSVRSIWKHVAAGQFPKPIRIGRSVRWRRDDLDEFFAAA